MYCAILTVHCLILRSLIEGMMRRDFDLFGPQKDSNLLIDNNSTSDAMRHLMSSTAGEAEVKCGEPGNECKGLFLKYIKDWLGYLIVGVVIIVVAVPEGLPLAVMISLSFSVGRMLEDQNFVKRLSSCEIMGGANNICSDKTGTLTKN
jgi:hypothetical protein